MKTNGEIAIIKRWGAAAADHWAVRCSGCEDHPLPLQNASKECKECEYFYYFSAYCNLED